MRVFNFAFVFVFFLILSSCEINESLFEVKEDAMLLKMVLIEGELYNEYVYNEAGLVVEEKRKFLYSAYNYNKLNQLVQSDHYWDERIVSSSSHILDELDKVTEWISPENADVDVYSKYEYNKHGKLTQISTHRLNSDYQRYSKFEYNNNGRIEKKTAYDENKVTRYEKYFYDTMGNLTRKERYNEIHVLQTTTEFEFDNHPNPYLGFRGLMEPGRNTNPNNIIKETYSIHFEVDYSVEKVQVTVNDYEYNSNGYPISQNVYSEYIYY